MEAPHTPRRPADGARLSLSPFDSGTGAASVAFASAEEGVPVTSPLSFSRLVASSRSSSGAAAAAARHDPRADDPLIAIHTLTSTCVFARFLARSFGSLLAFLARFFLTFPFDFPPDRSPGEGREVSGGRDALSLARPVNAAPSERLGAKGAQRVAQALVIDGCEITSVDLSGNEIGPEGVRFLANALREIERKAAALSSPPEPVAEPAEEASAMDIVALMKAKKAAAAAAKGDEPQPQPEPEPVRFGCMVVHF